MPSRTFWMPEQASTVAPSVDGVYYFIYWICVSLFVGIAIVTTLFVVKYRHREGVEHEPAAGHSTALELTWTIIPTLVVLMMFYFGFRGFMDMAVEPPNPLEVVVTARTWNWDFAYPGVSPQVSSDDGKLHIPVNTPVRFVLNSMDVIHSMFVPAFRIKRDAVPGRFNRFWVEATHTGEFDLYCAEYCGQNHSTMLTKVVVHTQEDFQRWLKEAAEWRGRKPPIQAGQGLIAARGCITCHSIDGTTINAPTFRNLYGSQVPLADGRTVTADDAYIMESIRNPTAKVHAGFPPMSVAFGPESLRDVDVEAIIWFMKSISENFKGDLTPGKTISQPTSRPAAPAGTQPRQQINTQSGAPDPLRQEQK
jgi:cytochrome c oxidase subunit 2